MPEIRVPCGKGFAAGFVDERNLLGVYHSALPESAGNEVELVDEALDNPVDSCTLEELASKASTAVVISSDHTRPVPSRIIMPRILERLRLGNPDIKITILIATGFHRATTKDELIDKFGAEIVESENIIVHDSTDSGTLVRIGTLPSGGALVVNKIAVETDLLVAEGFIEPHFFAGFSGGRKSVLPGVAAAETVMANHCAEFIMNPASRTGILDGNPIHEDMLFAAKAAKLAFIVNVVIDRNKKIVAAFAGDSVAAHRKGTDYLSARAGIEVPEADIVITGNGGYPLDQNLYQAVKSMTAGEAVCREDGVIIVCAGCCCGHGGDSFYRNLSTFTAQEILDTVAKTPRDKTIPDQWQYQILARIMVKMKVIVVTTECDHELIRTMGLCCVSTIDEALEAAYQICGREAKVAVIPDGVSVIAGKKRQD